MRLALLGIFILLPWGAPDLSAESPFQKLAVAETDFRFTVDDSPLKVMRQAITLRAVVREHPVESAGEEKCTDHTAYRAYHLELAYELDFIDRKNYAAVEFYKGKDLLHRLPLKAPSRTMTGSAGRRYELNHLAVNLEGVPLVLLESADRVNFSKTE